MKIDKLDPPHILLSRLICGLLNSSRAFAFPRTRRIACLPKRYLTFGVIWFPMNELPRTPIAIIIVAILGGCAQYRWQKQGATQQDFDRESYACHVEAAQLYPAAIVSEQLISGYRAPSTTTCYSDRSAVGIGNSVYGSGSTSCITNPGRSVPAVTYTTDANESNRSRAMQACLTARGWRLLEVTESQRHLSGSCGTSVSCEVEAFYREKRRRIPEVVNANETIVDVKLAEKFFELKYELQNFNPYIYTLHDKKRDIDTLIKKACDTKISRRHLEDGGRWRFNYIDKTGAAVLDVVVDKSMCD